ncbi:MAG: phosphatase PAP2 family protein [Candidatus Woesearchaeota archaeon]
MISGKPLIFITVGIILMILGMFIDSMINEYLYFPITPIIIVSQLWFLGLLGITILYYSYKTWGKQRMILNAILLSSIILSVQVIKLVFGRIRPTDYSPDYSFPSGHAAFAFALLPIAFSHSRKIGIIFMVAAILIGISRILLREHYFTDVIAGSLLGYSLSWVYIMLIGSEEQ